MQTTESISRDLMRLFIWYPFRWLVISLPVKAGLFMMSRLGVVHHKVSGGRVARIEARMRQTGCAVGPSSTRRYFENHYIDRLHIFLYPKLRDRASLEAIVRFENIEVLDEALKRGKGAILVQPHFGPVQITLLALKLYGYDPVQIGYQSDKGLSPIGRNVAFRYRLKYEAMLPPILNADKFLGAAYKHLKRGGEMLTTGDGAGGGVYIGEHVAFKFMDTERPFPLGPATWAIKTGAAYIPTFIIMDGYDSYRIVFEPPIEPIHNDLEADSRFVTGRFIEAFERRLRQNPHCWHFWDEIL